MADISMCNGDGCEAKHTCYRFTAKPCEHRQSYFTVPPIKDEGCEYYWNTENSPETRYNNLYAQWNKKKMQ